MDVPYICTMYIDSVALDLTRWGKCTYMYTRAATDFTDQGSPNYIPYVLGVVSFEIKLGRIIIIDVGCPKWQDDVFFAV